MKILTFSILSGGVILAALWGVGIQVTEALIIALLMLANVSFQIFVRGNVSWMEKLNYTDIRKKMPAWSYSLASSAGLLAIILVVSSATSSI